MPYPVHIFLAVLKLFFFYSSPENHHLFRVLFYFKNYYFPKFVTFLRKHFSLGGYQISNMLDRVFTNRINILHVHWLAVSDIKYIHLCKHSNIWKCHIIPFISVFPCFVVVVFFVTRAELNFYLNVKCMRLCILCCMCHWGRERKNGDASRLRLNGRMNHSVSKMTAITTRKQWKQCLAIIRHSETINEKVQNRVTKLKKLDYKDNCKRHVVTCGALDNHNYQDLEWHPSQHKHSCYKKHRLSQPCLTPRSERVIEARGFLSPNDAIGNAH